MGMIRKRILYNIVKLIPTKLYLRVYIRVKTGKKLNLKDPKTFTDKVNYLKLIDAPIKTIYSDKIAVKNVINNMNMGITVPKILWQGEKLTVQVLDKLPRSFVIKTNHFSGDVKIIKNKATITEKDLKKLNKYFKKIKNMNYYYFARENCYKNINSKLFIEEYLGDESMVTDYKFFCFNGKFEFCHIVEDRFTNLKDYMVDRDYSNLNFNLDTRSLVLNKRPKAVDSFEEMIKLAEVISKSFKFARIDFYFINNIIYFGEVTFYPWGGAFRILPKDYEKFIDNHYGDKIDLRSDDYE